MKYSALSLVLITISATAAYAYPKDFSGPFIGGALGGSYSTVGAGAFSVGGTGFPAGTSTNNGGGIEGGVMLGYLHKLSNSFPLHVGLRAGTTVGSNSGTEKTKSSSDGSTLNASHKYTRPHAFQGSMILGYPVSNTIMPFAIIGWENALWKHKVTTTAPMTATAKSSKRQNALLVGGGVMKKVSQNAAVGIQYEGAIHFDKQTSTGGGVSASHKSAQNHKFMTVVTYTLK